MAEEPSSSSSATTHFGAAILAHKFILKSKKAVKREEKQLQAQPHGAGRAVNLRQAILDKEDLIKANNRQGWHGAKSKNWDIIKKKLTTAKITDALTTLKFEVNGQKYTVLRPLGQGGFSQVFEVYNSSKALFALKVVSLVDQSSKTKQDLIREILFLEKLKNCQSVVRAFEYQIKETEDENQILVLMEKGDKDLHKILEKHKEDGSLSPAKLRFYWEQMLLAVKEVHHANIVHADIKPANFLLVSGDLKIIDFGMASELSPGKDHVLKFFSAGTKDFMSPEVLAGAIKNDEGEKSAVKLTVKVDVWALGIILYQTMYGVFPFYNVPGGKQSKVLALISLEHPVEFEEKANMDPELLDTMKLCLEKDPTKRPSVEELLEHPYLRPKHRQVEGPITCNKCKLAQNGMDKIYFKRERKANSFLL